MSKKLHTILYSALALGLISAVGIGSSSVSAHHVAHHSRVARHYHHRRSHRRHNKVKVEIKYVYNKGHHRVISSRKPRHRRYLKIRLRFTKKRSHHRRHHGLRKIRSGNNYHSEFARQARRQLVRDINKDRARHGLRKLKYSRELQHVSSQRNPHVAYAYAHYNEYKKYLINRSGNPSDNWIHGIDIHRTLNHYLKKDHYKFRQTRIGNNDYFWDSENAGDIYRGKSTAGKKHFKSNTGRQAGNNIERIMMKHDKSNGNHNGHRKTILNKRLKFYGIATYYNSRNNMLTAVEDFAS